MQRSVRSCLTLCLALASALSTFDLATAQDSDESKPADTVKITPYSGPPIFLDEPERQPDATLVGKVVDSQKYGDGKVRFEREIAKYSDNRLVADGFYREFSPSGAKF